VIERLERDRIDLGHVDSSTLRSWSRTPRVVVVVGGFQARAPSDLKARRSAASPNRRLGECLLRTLRPMVMSATRLLHDHAARRTLRDRKRTSFGASICAPAVAYSAAGIGQYRA
jgi:hypothetical protein